MTIIFYYIVYSFSWLVALIPLKILYVLSDLIFPVTYYVLGYRKKTVFENLHRSFPEKTLEEIRQIAKKFYHHLNDLLFESIKMIRLSPKQLAERIPIKNPEVFHDLYKRGKSVIAVVGHYNNWEWILGTKPYVPHHSIAVYKPLNNKWFDQFMIKIRSKYGTEIISMRKTLRTILEYKQKNILTVSAFIADQSPVWEEVQYWTRFLNQHTPVYLGIEKIAKKTDQAVVFLHVQKNGRGRYAVEIIKLFDEVLKTTATEITEKHTRLLEQIIRDKPEYWLWTHRRWKLVPKYMEQNGEMNE
jgi:KDO2-lipid IV(A) lauroyltransferase